MEENIEMKTASADTSHHARTITLDGQKTILKLDAPTWRAVEVLAARHGGNWRTWVADLLESLKERQIPVNNRAAVVRAAAFSLLTQAEEKRQQFAALARTYPISAEGVYDDALQAFLVRITAPLSSRGEHYLSVEDADLLAGLINAAILNLISGTTPQAQKTKGSAGDAA